MSTPRATNTTDVPSPARPTAGSQPMPPVAIVGVGCLFPEAPDPRRYSRNLIEGVQAFGQVPRERWEHERYYDPAPGAADRTYVRLGAFLRRIRCDWRKYRLPPRLVAILNPMQLALFEATAQALEDAGSSSPRLAERTGYVIGSLGLGVNPHHGLRLPGVPGAVWGVPDPGPDDPRAPAARRRRGHRRAPGRARPGQRVGRGGWR